jgi:hypothetical protein
MEMRTSLCFLAVSNLWLIVPLTEVDYTEGKADIGRTVTMSLVKEM